MSAVESLFYIYTVFCVCLCASLLVVRSHLIGG